MSARKRTEKAQGTTRRATRSVQSGSGSGLTAATMPNNRPPIRVPRATPKAITRNVSPTPASRAVPETRLRVAISVKATVRP
jgi:hypothetical protein